MASPLGTIYSRADALKRQLYDMLTNPSDAAAMLGGRIVESGQQAQALQEQTFADPNRPFRVTDPQAMARLTDMLMAGPMGFAPAGTISGATRDVIRSSADDLANQLNELGFQATVQHSGSRAGPSSYVQVYDPQTGRMFTSPVRFSGHGKGPREAAGVIEVQDPAADIPKIVQDALQMRQQGPSEVFQRQAIVDDLIAGGMKPKQAYKEADKRIAGLLDEPAQSSVRMYHGTDKAFDEYRVKNRGLAYYFTPDPKQAGFYSGMGEGANIRPVELNVKNTYRGGDVDKIMDVVKKEDDYYPYSLSKIRQSLENQTPLAFHTPSVVKALKKLGYDSFAEYEGGIEQIGVFSAKNVKPSFGQR